MKSKRDDEVVEAVLIVLEEAAEDKENMLLYIADAVKAYATTGEISNTLRNVFDEH